MIDAGRCVSWAACEIDSKPTNEMIASDVPSINWYGEGQLNCIVWINSWGWKANKNPRHRMADSLRTSSAETMPLNVVLSRTPTTLSAQSPSTSPKTTRKCSHGWDEFVRAGTSWLV